MNLLGAQHHSPVGEAGKEIGLRVAAMGGSNREQALGAN